MEFQFQPRQNPNTCLFLIQMYNDPIQCHNSKRAQGKILYSMETPGIRVPGSCNPHRKGTLHKASW